MGVVVERGDDNDVLRSNLITFSFVKLIRI
jgi:hypothetical protein